jgi:aromatic ring-opening dioxygenase catalytic subunit (LigB family)
MDFRPDAPVPAWAAEFDAWTADVLPRRDVDALLDYRQRAPGVRQALPTHEHFVPVVTALGSAVDDPDSDAQLPDHGVHLRVRDATIDAARLKRCAAARPLSAASAG